MSSIHQTERVFPPLTSPEPLCLLISFSKDCSNCPVFGFIAASFSKHPRNRVATLNLIVGKMVVPVGWGSRTPYLGAPVEEN